MEDFTIETGLTEGGNMLILKSVSGHIDLSAGMDYTFGAFLVYVLDFTESGKKLVELHQYDRLVKAERKFDRLNAYHQ